MVSYFLRELNGTVQNLIPKINLQNKQLITLWLYKGELKQKLRFVKAH